MRVGILGSGLMAKLGTLFARAGHEVIFSYVRSMAKLEKLAREAQGSAASGPLQSTRKPSSLHVRTTATTPLSCQRAPACASCAVSGGRARCRGLRPWCAGWVRPSSAPSSSPPALCARSTKTRTKVGTTVRNRLGLQPHCKTYGGEDLCYS
jgi:hypothetical protein